MPAPSSTPATALATFRIRLLGPFAVERDGIALDMARWQRRMARLFKLLAIAPHRRRTRDELLELLWPDASEEAAGANLRLVLHRLRQVLVTQPAPAGERPSPLLFEHGWVALHPAYSWELDLDRFSELIATAGDAIPLLEAAAALHRGVALEEELYEDWAAPCREQVARQYRQLCLRLATLHRAQASPERAVEWLERVLEADPLDEEALRELLLTLEALTRETEALRRFRRFEQLLAEELDVPPDVETLGVAARIAERLRQSEVAIPVVAGERSAAILPVIPSYPLSTAVPLIDRETALEALAETLVGEAREGPRCLLLAAEAGVGKTRLLAEAAVRARHQGMLTLAGGSYEQEGHLPYGPIHDALLDYILAQPEELLQAQLDGLLPELARVVPELRLRVGNLAPDWPGEAEGLRLRLFTAVAQVLARIAEDRPLLLLLDDLHWTDEGTLQLLHFLLRQKQLGRVRIVGAYRLEEVRSDTPLARWLVDVEGDDSLAISSPSLASLNETEITALLEERLRGPCSESLARVLYERSAGNPLFALQMLRLLQQEGRLEQASTGWRLADVGGAEDGGTLLPAKVRGTVARRLRKLSRDEREALTIGAVMGREFSYAAIEALWEGEQTFMFQALEGAVNAYLLAETESGFAFRHPILREVVYGGTSQGKRVQLHRRAGLFLQALFGPPDWRCEPQHAVQLAWHFLQGQEPQQALGYAVLAGDQAEEAFAHRQAERHYRAALDLARQLADGPAERQALERLGNTLTVLGRYDEAETVLEQAAAGYAAANDLEGQWRTVAQIGQLHLKIGALEQGLNRVAHALQTQKDSAPSRGLGALYLALSSLAFRSGRYTEQLQAAERAIEIARELGDRIALARAQLNRAFSLPWLGTSSDFRLALEDVIASAEEIGDLPTLARALCAVADPYTTMGEFANAREALARALEIAERVGDPSRIAFTANVCGLSAYARGEWNEAETFFSRSLAIYRELGARADTMIPLFGLGAVWMGRGEWDEGSAALEEHLALAHQTGDFRWLHAAQVLLAERDLLEERPGAALARFESVARLPDLSDIARAAVLPALARTYLELGDAGLAVTTALEAAARASEEDDRQALIEALWVHGMALTRQQCWPEAEACYRRALELLDQTPYPYARGRVLHAYGLALSDRGEREPACTRLREALDIFQQLAARPYIERTSQALADFEPA